MKKVLILFAVVLFSSLNSFSQATSLTIDNQTPGWLSSLIPYSDQETLQSIKVTGYINGTDIKFIRELNKNRSLNGCIDLEDANIVSGGSSYGGSDGYISVSTTTADNQLTQYMFAYLNPIRKIILPKSLIGFTENLGYAFQFLNTEVDTLVINGSMESIARGNSHDNIYWKTRCIYFPDGIKDIDFRNYFHEYAKLDSIEIFFPSNLEKVSIKNGNCKNETAVFHCSSNNPESIIENYVNGAPGRNIFEAGTIYVPKGTKEKYEQSIFHNLIIIEDVPVEGITMAESQSLYVGDIFKMNAKVIPEDALNQKIKWENSNNDVVSVSEDGLVTAISHGTTDITAITDDGGFKATCKVTVFDHTTGIKMAEKVTLPIGEQYSLNAKTLPLTTSDGKISFSCNDNSIATVSETPSSR